MATLAAGRRPDVVRLKRHARHAWREVIETYRDWRIHGEPFRHLYWLILTLAGAIRDDVPAAWPTFRHP